MGFIVYLLGQSKRLRGCSEIKLASPRLCPVARSSVIIRFVLTTWANGSLWFDQIGQWELLIWSKRNGRWLMNAVTNTTFKMFYSHARTMQNPVLDRIGRAERGRRLDWQSVWEGQQDDDNEDQGVVKRDRGLLEDKYRINWEWETVNSRGNREIQ